MDKKKCHLSASSPIELQLRDKRKRSLNCFNHEVHLNNVFEIHFLPCRKHCVCVTGVKFVVYGEIAVVYS
jgi:hypothetical protein